MDAKKPTILINEIDPEGKNLLNLALKQNYILLFSSNHAELFQHVAQKKPDLIILGSKPSYTENYDLCAQLKEDFRTQLIPVLLEIDSENDVNIEGLEITGVDFFSRQINSNILFARVQNLLELKQLRDQFTWAKTTDFLPGLVRLQYLEQILSHEWRRALRLQTPQSILILSIDSFDSDKNQSDQLTSDKCLHQIADLLVKTVKRETDCVAQSGENEFIILLPETDTNGALQVARQIQEALEELSIPHPPSALSTHITACIGFATMRPKQKQTSIQLIQKASALLSEAKQAGVNQIRYTFDK
jgi:diguanylate cyclase (GGDEF)-like protein